MVSGEDEEDSDLDLPGDEFTDENQAWLTPKGKLQLGKSDSICNSQ